MDLEEDMMATVLHFPTLQTAVTRSPNLMLLEIIQTTSGMDINRISNVALDRVDLGELLEVVEGPQDQTEGCLKWMLSKWIKRIHRITWNAKTTLASVLYMLPEELLSICSPLQEVCCKGTIFITHNDRTTVASFILPGYGKKWNNVYSACSVLSIILSLAHEIQIPHPC